MSEFEKTWQKINAIQKRSREEQEQLRVRQKEEELRRQQQVGEQKQKEFKILSSLDFVQNFAPQFLKEINQEFFSNEGTIEGWKEEQTDRHSHKYYWKEQDGDCSATYTRTSLHYHILSKLGVKLSTKDGDISIFVPLKEHIPDWDSRRSRHNWHNLTSKVIPLEDIYVEQQCYFGHKGISLELERDEIVKQIREQVLSLVVHLKTLAEG